MADYYIGGNELEARVNNSSQIFRRLVNYTNLGFERIADFYYLTLDKAKNLKEDWIYSFEALGKDEKVIKISKIKTMYGLPSEDEFNEVDHLGKPKNGSSRVIPSRRFLREHHLDEILNILSWIKGDLKFVGIRPKPLSNWQTNYTEDERRLLLQEKPALNGVPYAKPWQPARVTELQYIKELKEEPQLTDLKYFFDIWYNKFKGHGSH